LSEFSTSSKFIFEVEDIIFKTELDENRFTRFNSVWGVTLEAVLDAIEEEDMICIKQF
jgi:hypothetical protein